MAETPTIPQKYQNLKTQLANLISKETTTKEDKSNKVSSWSNTTTDTHYPSEKLVKDSLNGKADSTHTHEYDDITLTNITTTIDYNDYTTQGFYKIWYTYQTGSTNKPTTDGGLLVVNEIPYGNLQFFIPYINQNGTAPKHLYYRTHYGSGGNNYWSNWEQIIGGQDIIDNLTSTDTNKPLSAKQGKELKALIDNKEDKIYRIVGTEVSSPSSSSARLHCGTLPFDNISGKIFVYVVPNISSLSASQKALIYGTYPSGSNISYNIFKSNNEYLTIGDIQTGDELLLMDDGNVRVISNSSVSNKEDKSNKVTSWSSTTTDTHYPSEKLVKDSLDGKADSTHTHEYDDITITNISTNIDYNDYTTKGQYYIWYAQQSGNTNKPTTGGGLLVVDLIPNGVMQRFFVYGTDKKIYWRTYYNQNGGSWNSWVRLDNKEDLTNKVTSLSSSSTDTQYPSAKAVKDNLDLKVNKQEDSLITVTNSNIWNYSDYHTKDRWSSEGSSGGSVTSTTLTSGSQGDGYYSYNFPSNVTEISMEISSSASNCLIVLDTGSQTPIPTRPMTFTATSDNGFNISIPNSNVTVTYSITSITFNMNTWIDKIYPIGAIYISMVNVNPSTLFGGEWTALESRFLIGHDGTNYWNGATGGSADAVVVSHNHSPTSTDNKFLVSKDDVAINGTKRAWASTGSSAYYVYSPNTPSGINENANTTTVGVSGTGKNMPPYIGVYMWKRIG